MFAVHGVCSLVFDFDCVCVRFCVFVFAGVCVFSVGVVGVSLCCNCWCVFLIVLFAWG